MKFLIDNAHFVAALILSGGFLIWPEIRKLISGSNELGTLQTIQLMNHKGAVLLDVRESAEIDGKRIPNSKHIPLSELGKRAKELEKFKDKPIIVSCRSGMRTPNACRTLKKLGFNDVYQLKGGLSAWQQASLPLEKAG